MTIILSQPQQRNSMHVKAGQDQHAEVSPKLINPFTLDLSEREMATEIEESKEVDFTLAADFSMSVGSDDDLNIN